MFCQKCGNQLAEDAAFCPKCGTKITQVNLEGSLMENNITGHVCPKCGSKNLNSVIKPKVSGGNSTSDACCGYALLGPLGLLCGMHKSNVDNQTFWVCQDCGEQFRDSKEMSSDMLSKGIACVIVGGFMLWAEIESSIWWPLWIFGIGLVTIGITLIVLVQKSKQ